MSLTGFYTTLSGKPVDMSLCCPSGALWDRLLINSSAFNLHFTSGHLWFTAENTGSSKSRNTGHLG